MRLASQRNAPPLTEARPRLGLRPNPRTPVRDIAPHFRGRGSGQRKPGGISSICYLCNRSTQNATLLLPACTTLWPRRCGVMVVASTDFQPTGDESSTKAIELVSSHRGDGEPSYKAFGSQ